MASAKTLVCVVGPTAVGKTAVGIPLAQHFQTAILSADSRQFYREMTIGTAKPSDDELAAAPHHFINSHHITEDYSAGDFERDALALLEKLFLHHDVVILVGGSGLFVRAVCQGLDDLPKALPGVRDRLNTLYREQGLEPLQRLLQQVDPAYFDDMDNQNPQRVIRALEVYESTGTPFSHLRHGQAAERPFDVVNIGLDTDRELLYQRINSRVDAMMAAGLLNEVESLLPHREKPPLKTVGYAELFDYLDGKCTLEDAVDKIKQNTRRYAKRQLTWFRKDKTTVWFAPDDIAGMIAYISSRISLQ
ncbi:tRNA (adenosine(37)-N6)-dimethylallyltransferase MiaA [Parapedobacter sp. 10938]|uniref:tRNA (adenosine(37)-N6)-dimethylallyltransferase MiaA n=1 Tax=Parapedobacter flavus TaxID=3110225 RepID=UPI002DB6E9AB|nr:tRNA (adenosine(37)-N6)-dimethylallyltransferase MiaA [Parapedobacter sp. 10938]MEC3879361.1 tRNA (adenosine(37)-N6)-dimethylallyltransferase MiaA [Parapedobacter sp. 10938]